MTGVRVAVLACAVLAIADGDVLEALGLLLFVVVLCVAWPGGVAPRPVGVTVWWPGARWRR